MKLNDICEVYSGYALKEFNNDSNGFPVIKIGNIIVDGSLALDDCQFTTETVNEKYYSQYGDIYVALSGATTGKIGIMQTQKKHIINQRVGIVRKKADDIPNAFIKYFLMYQTDRILQEASGCAQPNISPKQIALYEIPEFEPKEISKIVDALDNATDIIKMRQQQLTKFDELVKARFVEMFSEYQNRCSLNELCSIITDGTHQPPKFQNEGIPFIFVSNLANNTVTYNAEKFISDETYNELIKRTPIEIGDVLLTTVGSYGHPAVVVEDRKFLFQRHIAYLKPKRDAINSFFLHSAILAPDAQRQIEEKVKGIAQKTLNLSEIRKITIPVPSIDEQNAFEVFVKQVDKSKVAVQKALDEAQTLFDSLMQQYFG